MKYLRLLAMAMLLAGTGTAYAASPSITSLTPGSGAVGSSIVIAGANFGSSQSKVKVTFSSGKTATITKFNSTSITATVPSGAVTGNVVVTVGSTASNGVSFTVTPAPSITSLTPSSGAVSSSIVIAGSNFGSPQGTGNVAFNGKTATISSWATGSITAIVPSSATTGNVVVTAAGGVSSSGVTFTVTPAPSITSLNPASGATGSSVGINGSNFGSPQGTGSVTFTGTAATISSWNSGSITAVVPSGATTGNVVVTAAGGVASNGAAFTVAPNITSLTPSRGEPGASVTIAGSNFMSTTGTVSFNGKTATVTSWNTGSIVAVVPNGASSGNVVVTAGSLQSNGVAFTVLSPTISSLNPASGPVGTSVKIAGSNFGGSAGTVTFNGQTATTTAWSDGSITTTVPTGATSGNVVVSNSGLQSNGVNFVVDVSVPVYSGGVSVSLGIAQAPTVSDVASSQVSVEVGSSQDSSIFSQQAVSIAVTPSISGISLGAGPVGSAVTISGANFGPSSELGSLSINGVAATATSWSSGSIVTSVPVGANPLGNIVVTVNTLSSNSVSYKVTPAITVLSPSAGVAGTTVFITGSSFGASQSGGSVSFNGLSATVLSWSNGAISVQVPSGATSGNVAVTTGLGLGSNGQPFTVPNNLSIALVSPASGSSGTSVTITGGGFGVSQGTSVLTFNRNPATVTSWNDSQIMATVPPGSTTGFVSVTVGGATVFSPTLFTLSTTTQVSDSLGNNSSYTAAMVGGNWVNTASTGSGCSSCTVRGNIENTYNSSGNLISHTDELGHVTTYTYDSNNNLASESIQLNTTTTVTTSYTYNSFGEVLTATDALGNVTTNTYDGNGNLLTVTTPVPNGNTAASVTQFAYNTLGELTQITDALGNVTQLAYTPAGLISTITDAQSNVTTYHYDAHGNRAAIIDALQNTTSFAYDAMDRLTTITYPDKSMAGFGYDYRGRRTSVTDQNRKITAYAYDDADRLMSITDAATHLTQYGYDTENNLLSITDASNNVTSFAYDAFGRVTQTTFPSTFTESYTYDAASNLSSKTDRNGQAILYVYDALNRLTYKQYPDSTDVEYVYDLAGKIKQVSDPTGTYGFEYDNMGRLIATTTRYSFLPNLTFNNTYGYDANSNRTSFTAPDGSTNTYQYDTLNRLSTLTNSLTGQFTFVYDALNRRTSLGRPNGVATNYSYDSLSRLLSVLHQAGGGTVDGETYSYDSASNRTSKTNQLNNITEQYSYDAIYQLLQVTQGTTTTESYTYDPAGNRLSSLTVPQWSYNGSNELTSNTLGAFTYDKNGNTLTKVISGNATQYTWDFENRLSSVTLSGTGGTVAFMYDPLGRRIQKVFTQGATTIITNYLYDGADDVEEVDQSGNLLARYTQGPGIDQPLAELRSGSNSYYEQNGLRSVTSLSSSTGALANTYVYKPFGNLASSSGSAVNPFQFTGRDYDPETGLRYYRARYYDSQIGRFASEDPIRFFAGNNFYDYVLNHPTDLVDPAGKFPIHGKWCGPNWTGGRVEPYDPAHDTTGPDGYPYYMYPVDYTDEVCKDHDICYYTCRQDHKCDRGARRDCMRDCDKTLIYYLTRFPGRYEGPIDALSGLVVSVGIAGHSYYPDAGDNDKSCPGCFQKPHPKNRLK